MFTADRLQSMMSAAFNKNAPKFEVQTRMPFRCTLHAALCARTKWIWQRGNAAKNRMTTLKSLPNDLPNKSSPSRPLDGPKAYLVTYSVHTAISVCLNSRPYTGGEWSRHLRNIRSESGIDFPFVMTYFDEMFANRIESKLILFFCHHIWYSVWIEYQITIWQKRPTTNCDNNNHKKLWLRSFEGENFD